MSSKRKLAKDRRDEVMDVALVLSVAVGYTRVTRDMIAQQVGLTPQAIQHHIGTMAALRRDIMRKAIADECLHVIAQGMANRDEHAFRASSELLGRARAAL
jgi:AcrR family transcriptional regulator